MARRRARRSHPRYGAGAVPKQATAGPGMYGQGATGHPGTTAAVAPAAKPVAPQPPDPAFEAWKAQQGLQRGLNDNEALYQQGRIGQSTGYNALGQRDYSSPYSQAALYEESYKRAKYDTKQGFSSQGMLYDGSYGQMQGENARNYSIGSDQLQRSAADQYHGIAQQQAQAGITYGQGLTQEQLQALYRALEVS